LNSKDPDTLQACLKYVHSQLSVLKAINLTSLSTYRGNSEALKVSIEKFDLLLPFDNVSLVQTCMRTNDVTCLDLVLIKLRQQNISINLGTIKVLLALDTNESRKAVLEKQIIDVHTKYVESLYPIKGELKQRYVFSDSKNMTIDLINEGVDTNVPGAQM